MPSVIGVTGGAEIGLVTCSWPLARLVVSPDRLTLRVLVLGRYEFRPDQVVSIERYTFLPVLAAGLRFNHVLGNYPKRVIFWTVGDPDKVLAKIRGIGFVPCAGAESIHREKGIPLRWQAIAVWFVLWNLLFWLEGQFPLPKRGFFAITALVLTFLMSLLTPRWPLLQRVFLRPGRNIGEVRHGFRFMALVTGFIALAFTLVLLLGGEIHSG